MQVYVEALIELQLRRFFGCIYILMKLRPGQLRLRVAIGGFGEITVCVEFAPVEAIDDDVRPAARLVVHGFVHSAGEFLGIDVAGVGTAIAIAVRDARREQDATMRHADDERQIARQIFDVVVGTEIRLTGYVGLCNNGCADSPAQQKQEIFKHRK